jgi:hypothetical protein
MRKYLTKVEKQCYELGMKAGRKELEPALAALKQAITDIKTLRTIQHSGMTLPHIQKYLEQAISQAEGSIK